MSENRTTELTVAAKRVSAEVEVWHGNRWTEADRKNRHIESGTPNPAQTRLNEPNGHSNQPIRWILSARSVFERRLNPLIVWNTLYESDRSNQQQSQTYCIRGFFVSLDHGTGCGRLKIIT